MLLVATTVILKYMQVKVHLPFRGILYKSNAGIRT